MAQKNIYLPPLETEKFKTNDSQNRITFGQKNLVQISQKQSPQIQNDNQNQEEDNFILFEDYDQKRDELFIQKCLVPYLRDLYQDLLMRSNQTENVDKVSFIEYTKLPGIINDRLHVLFSDQYFKSSQSSPLSSPLNTQKNQIKQQPEKKKNDHVTLDSFVQNFTTIFMGDLSQKMKFTFNMYDFDNDGFISAEDIRIIMSYMPFKRNIQLQNVSSLLESKGMDDLMSQGIGSPSSKALMRVQQRQKQKEGIYQDEEGKSVDYKDRMSDQEEIKMFTETIFNQGINSKKMDFRQYNYINKSVSSEMFYTLMAILHEKLPCSTNFYRMRKNYREYSKQTGQSSPVKLIASPKMIRGLSISKSQKRDKSADYQTTSPARVGSPDVRIKTSHKVDRNYSSQLSNNKPNDININRFKFSIDNKSDNISNDGFELQTENQFISRSFFQDGNKSPHKLTQMNKLRRFDDNSVQSKLSGIEEKKKIFSPNVTQQSFAIKLNNMNKNQTIKNNILESGNNSQNASKRIIYQKFSDHSPQSNNNQLKQESPFNFNEQIEPLQGFGDQSIHDQNILEGQCFLKTKTDRYKEHWAVLVGKELYCYRQKGDPEHRVMHSLIGTFYKESPNEKSESENCTLYPCKIILPPNKSRILYFKNESQQKQWIEQLKNLSGFSNIFDFYKFEENLGKGQFGLVKLATHKKNGKKVAVKTIHKKDMKQIEVYQQRREIEVLKMSQHPNIVALIDLFENSEYYYIVLEYMQGKDLFDYIQFRNFQLSEQRVKQIAYQLAQALIYLHNYGIVHRDLKLENVMMTDNTDASVPKLVDFGLAKMIGPNEKADEPFGTLGYVAPEVLRKEPYSFSCDLWSLGCILYALLSGSLPFDHENQKETIRLTLESKLEFDLPQWKNISESCIDLIQRLLQKDPKKRITLDQTIKHPWFIGIDFNKQTGIVNSKCLSQNFKQKKLNINVLSENI